LGLGATVATICSGGKGCSVNCKLVVVVFPATSNELALKLCGPAVITLIGSGQTATPESASEQVKFKVAELPRTIPLASGGGVRAALTTGLVKSTFTTAEVDAVCPTASVRLPLMF
jgi:hypothetical protein